MVERKGTSTWQRVRIAGQSRETEFREQLRDETAFRHAGKNLRSNTECCAEGPFAASHSILLALRAALLFVSRSTRLVTNPAPKAISKGDAPV